MHHTFYYIICKSGNFTTWQTYSNPLHSYINLHWTWLIIGGWLACCIKLNGYLQQSFIRFINIITLIYHSSMLFQIETNTMKVLLLVKTNFRDFYKMHWPLCSLIRGFKHYELQSMGKLNIIGFLFSWFKWNTK